MNNQLPNKLVMLRKYYNYSQQDIAEKMGVSISEYMKWENGSSICSMSQLLRISRILKVSLDDLFNNNIVIKLPDSNFGDSIEIPFNNINNKNNETTAFDIPIINDEESTAEKTIITRVISENQMEEVETIQDIKPIKKIKKENIEIQPKKTKNNLLPIYIGASAIVLLISFIFIFRQLNKKSNSVNIISNNSDNVILSDINRLSAGVQSTFYLQNKGDILSKGNKIDTSKFSNAVQLSSLGNYLLGLNSDGSIICSGVGCNIINTELKDFKMISAGKNHSLALRKNGEVICMGNSTVCDGVNFKNVSYIFAGSDESFAISDGNVLYSGNSSKKSDITSLKGIKSLYSSSNYLAVVTNSGQVKVVSLKGEKDINASSFSNIKMVVTGSDFVAGLDENGSVHFEGSKEMKDIVSTWKNIKYISANEDYIIAVGSDNKIIGAGSNKYSQFDILQNNSTPTPSTTSETKTKLDKVSNIKFTESVKSLLITWDNVKDADNYQVSINVGGNYTVKSSTNSLAIEASKLLPNTEYTVSITANSNNSNFTSSDPTIINYRYISVAPEVKKYTVTFYDYDGKTVLNQQQVDEGGSATPPDVSSLTKDNSTFSNWNPAFEDKATKDVVYTAVYKCTITLENGEIINPDSSGRCSCPASTEKNSENKCVVKTAETTGGN